MKGRVSYGPFHVRLLAIYVVALGGIVASTLIADSHDGFAGTKGTPRDLWIHPRVETYDPERHYQDDSGELYYEETSLAAEFTGPIEVSRSLATGDIDGDGDLDVLLTNTQSAARLYRNDAPRQGHWLIVRALDPRLGRDNIQIRIFFTFNICVLRNNVFRSIKN